MEGDEGGRVAERSTGRARDLGTPQLYTGYQPSLMMHHPIVGAMALVSLHCAAPPNPALNDSASLVPRKSQVTGATDIPPGRSVGVGPATPGSMSCRISYLLTLGAS
eukprot:m.251811 g.251811  ORF g.251811 m.251811 type:complete len:107 (-) comp26507_c0_seq2:1083-1403(-)